MASMSAAGSGSRRLDGSGSSGGGRIGMKLSRNNASYPLTNCSTPTAA